jgi:phosphonate transport system substrate-binding protein
MSDVAAPAKKSSPARLILLALVLCAIAGGVYAWFYYTNQTQAEVHSGTLLQGYLVELPNYAKLEFPDADGNLVADTPATGPFLKPTELVFEEVAGDDPAVRAKQWEPFLKHLTEKTGLPARYGQSRQTEDAVELRASATVKDQIEALKSSKVHLTAFTTGQVQMAVNMGGFVPLFAPADAANSFGYQMEVIVPANSPAKTISDLKGKKVAFVAMSSNSGAKAPIVIFHEKFQLMPGRDYDISVAGRHELAMKMVADGKIDAACVASDLLKGERTNGVLKDNPDAVRSIFVSETFPAVCFGIPHNLDPELAKKVRTAFQTFSFTGNGVGERYRGQWIKFVPVDYKKDWAFVRDIDDRLVKLAQEK